MTIQTGAAGGRGLSEIGRIGPSYADRRNRYGGARVVGERHTLRSTRCAEGLVPEAERGRGERELGHSRAGQAYVLRAVAGRVSQNEGRRFRAKDGGSVRDADGAGRVRSNAGTTSGRGLREIARRRCDRDTC